MWTRQGNLLFASTTDSVKKKKEEKIALISPRQSQYQGSFYWNEMSGHTNSKLTVSLFSGANKASANVLENPDLTGFEIQTVALVIYTMVSLLVIDTVPGFTARFSEVFMSTI